MALKKTDRFAKARLFFVSLDMTYPSLLLFFHVVAAAVVVVDVILKRNFLEALNDFLGLPTFFELNLEKR